MGEQKESRTAAAGIDTAWSVVAVLLAALLAWGGIGWLLDHFLGTALFVPIGLIVGAVGGTYLVSKRFGAADERPARRD